MSRLIFIGAIVVVVVISGSVLLLSSPSEPQEPTFEEQIASRDITEPEAIPQNKKTMISIPAGEPKPEVQSAYLSSYTILDEGFGTEVLVVVDGDKRVIKSNSIPNYETGEFPNEGNPNKILPQDLTYSFPLTPTRTTSARSVQEPGVAINGVKFEPGTAEEVTCESGETYRIEAFQKLVDLGIDDNDAHVQPNGTYHYRGVPHKLIEKLDSSNDLTHVGFARDGHLIYYSKSGAYTSSYQVASTTREGQDCTYEIGKEVHEIEIASSTTDGTFVSDWEYVKGLGNLDQCNGVRLGEEYAYIITDTYPYIGRCLTGIFTESRPMQPPPHNPDDSDGPPPDGPPPQ